MFTNVQLWRHSPLPPRPLPPSHPRPSESPPGLFSVANTLNIYHWGQLSGEQLKCRSSLLRTLQGLTDPAEQNRPSPNTATQSSMLMLTLPPSGPGPPSDVSCATRLLSAAGSFSCPFVFICVCSGPGVGEDSALQISAPLPLALSWSSRTLLPAFCSRIHHVLAVY